MGWEAEGGGGGQREGGAGREAAEGGGLWGNAYKQLHMGDNGGGTQKGCKGVGMGRGQGLGMRLHNNYITTT